MDTFKTNIKQWVMLDNQLKEYNEKSKILREKKKELVQSLYSQADSSNLLETTIAISDGRLTFRKIKQQQALTLDYIEGCLHNCISNESTINKIMSHIKHSREISFREDIKRVLNKTT